MLVPTFTGSTTFRVPVPCTYDLELAAAKYFHAVRDGEVPLAFNFNGTIYYRGDDGRLQMSLVPWSCSAEYRLPLAIWHELIDHYFPTAAGSRCSTEHAATRCGARRRGAGADDRRLRGRAAGGARVSDALERLVDSLLYEGYALYPYTPGATKNATPTPFGIVYPPAYARRGDAPSTSCGSSACSRPDRGRR